MKIRVCQQFHDGIYLAQGSPSVSQCPEPSPLCLLGFLLYFFAKQEDKKNQLLQMNSSVVPQKCQHLIKPQQMRKARTGRRGRGPATKVQQPQRIRTQLKWTELTAAKNKKKGDPTKKVTKIKGETRGQGQLHWDPRVFSKTLTFIWWVSQRARKNRVNGTNQPARAAKLSNLK